MPLRMPLCTIHLNLLLDSFFMEFLQAAAATSTAGHEIYNCMHAVGFAPFT